MAMMSTTDEADDTFVTLKPVGMYYLGLDEAALMGNGTESVAATAKPVQVFSYSGTGRADSDHRRRIRLCGVPAGHDDSSRSNR